MNNLQIGTLGWLHSDWVGGFYPDDMPQEWQLDYYSNAFRVVLVPENQWLSWSDEDLEECVDGVEGEFGYYLKVEQQITEDKAQQLQAVQQGLGSLLKGVVVFSETEIPEAMIHGQPVTLVSTSLRLPGWSYQTEAFTLSGNPLGFCAQLQEDGKWQAALLKDFMYSLPDNISGAAFFIGGDSINMTQVANLKVVGEFLGY